MLRNHSNEGARGQVILEYSLVAGAIILVMFAMSTLIKRGSQSMIKTVADQIGVQENSDQKFDDTGHLESTYVSSRTTSSSTRGENIGDIFTSMAEDTHTDSNAHMNLGFTEEY